ncbi:uncharacterized protein LOC121985492 isoform X2 [Zingiber officinale]|nr:uncharacterized protein LOC121985492 isoform X2 [Zingiber officinale]
MQGLQLRSTFSVSWSYEELEVLKQGLVRYANEPNMLKYVKVAAMLPDKTVRDVAMRCRWMTKKETGKRRKSEDFLIGKKMKDRKDKLIGSSSVAFLHQSRSKDESAYSSMRQNGNNSSSFLCGATSLIDSRTRKLLDDNIKILQQIAANLNYNEIHNNNDLFCRSKQNLAAILNRMNGMAGIMSQMPPLPVNIDDNLMSLLPCITHTVGHNILDEGQCHNLAHFSVHANKKDWRTPSRKWYIWFHLPLPHDKDATPTNQLLQLVHEMELAIYMTFN